MLERSEANETESLRALTRAVTTVCADVLRLPDVGPDDDINDLCTDMRTALGVVTLLNQWLGTSLTVGRLFRERTPARLALALRRSGVSAPPAATGSATATTAGAGDGGAPRAEADFWRDFWDTTYRFSSPALDDEFNTAGWLDKRTLAALPEAPMREWVDATVARLRALPGDRVLDVGCGTGLILFALAPERSRYVGVDFSAEAVGRVRARVATSPRHAGTEVLRAAAHEAAAAVGGEFDLIVLNSVVQYFPDADHLTRVLASLAGLLAPGGAIFVGDVRNADLHGALHASLVAADAPDDARAARVHRAVERSMTLDNSLLLGPRRLTRIVRDLWPGAGCRVQVRRGVHPTEMNRFRYDALVVPEGPPAAPEPERLPWAGPHRTGPVAAALAAALRRGPADLVVRDVPDERSFGAARLAAALATAPEGETMGELRRRLVPVAELDPEHAWRLGHAHGYGAAVAPGAHPGHVDLAFRRGRDDAAAAALLD
ncbi:methyltransferase [Streptomyces sp. B6B3]|uniref:methyltransferase n=1 Tax=Streptomyces sp. B6B3 TaxID=3153570 RepID=UPI00325D944D